MTYNIWNLFFAVATVEFSFAVFAKRHEFILAANAEEAIDQLAKYSLLDLRFAQRYYVYIRKLLLEYGIFELFSINVKITVATDRYASSSLFEKMCDAKKIIIKEMISWGHLIIGNRFSLQENK